jgi:hypothetical protein
MSIIRFILIGILLAVVTGCSGSQATLRGTVTARGKPLEEGFVSLMPIAGHDAATAGAPVENGVFVVTNLKPGKYRITIAGGGRSKPVPASQSDMMKMSERDLRIEGQVPANARGNNQDIEVKPGVQELDITLDF